eukprot:s6135_g8.t1
MTSSPFRPWHSSFRFSLASWVTRPGQPLAQELPSFETPSRSMRIKGLNAGTVGCDDDFRLCLAAVGCTAWACVSAPFSTSNFSWATSRQTAFSFRC